MKDFVKKNQMNIFRQRGKLEGFKSKGQAHWES